ncbi:VWA domain-containing protein [Massilia sp. PAMC28688]|uniref:VWA domain-containing protein n=1 Tax=Massilia sp. PAMC28688 TaxID=2861283 RepID=UPI001C624F1E|nr:VWA domain-containing protein [Massilia sp. PAMC28688]QYF92228.1 VWA domain-containing protein [Massilia sp. PAMC28688]
MSTEITKEALARRWRLLLGSEADNLPLPPQDAALERTLSALYDKQEGRGGLGGSAPNVARWLGDIREYFPSSVVQVMQKDAMERLGLERMLLEPEMLRSVQPDVHLVATLLSLNHMMPRKTKDTARQVVRVVVEELERKLANPLRQAVSGSLNRAARNNRPRHNEINWLRTIRANLKHYQADYQTIIPETRVGFARKSQSLRDIVLCVDQSGSMAPSVVYASVFAAVLASIKAVSTQVVVFDTAVVDLTPLLQDPVEVLFGTQLGGGTDIDKALAYCQGLVKRPQETIFVLISDLYEGGNAAQMLSRAAAMAASGMQMIALLALDDSGAPSYDRRHAAHFAQLGIPCFACTPDKFPDLMASAIKKQDMSAWAAQNNIAIAA